MEVFGMTFSGITAAAVTACSAAVAAIVGVINMITGLFRGRTIRDVKQQTDGMAHKMATLAGEAGEAKGAKAAKEAGEAKAAALAEGQAQGRAEKNNDPR
jgi:hypothetical protein